MSLKTRIERLEAKLGTEDSPKRILVAFGEDETCHAIHRHGDTLHLTVPCPYGDDWRDHLSPEQRELIGLADSVAAYHSFDDGRDPDLPPLWSRPAEPLDAPP
ncbi:MAG TPA: hypothetical protein VFF52_12015 [Isosphaeraceae bacterium]|nr:hypothetical protein [Isosphaeraceae bacterium]